MKTFFHPAFVGLISGLVSVLFWESSFGILGGIGLIYGFIISFLLLIKKFKVGISSLIFKFVPISGVAYYIAANIIYRILGIELQQDISALLLAGFVGAFVLSFGYRIIMGANNFTLFDSFILAFVGAISAVIIPVPHYIGGDFPNNIPAVEYLFPLWQSTVTGTAFWLSARRQAKIVSSN